MAIGDDASAAGFALVPSTGAGAEVNLGAQEINRTRDYVAQTKSLIVAGFPEIAAYKTTALTRSTTSQTDDPDLTLTLAASSKYHVVCELVYSGTGGMSYSWDSPSGATGGYAASMTEAVIGPGVFSFTWGTPVDLATDAGVVMGVRLGGMLITSSGGTLAFKWAPTASSHSIVLGLGSLLRASKLA